MSAQTTALGTLARRVASGRPVGIATLRRREQEAYRLCVCLDEALGLLTGADDDAWFAVMAVRTCAHADHTAAYRRVEAAWQEAQAERHEAEELAAALQAERLDALAFGELAA